MIALQPRRTTPRGRFLSIILVAGICTLLFFLLFHLRDAFFVLLEGPEIKCSITRQDREQDTNVSVARTWKHLIHDLNESEFVAEDGTSYDIATDAYRWQSLGKKMLILDVDSRLDSWKGGMLSAQPMTHAMMKPRTGGFMNHMVYALIHGYDYRLVRPPPYTDRHGTWVKVPVIREALKTHDIVVFLDSDAVFEKLNLPLEWLMSHWNITDQTLIAMPEDVNQVKNHDVRGNLYLNTGVIIAQQSERTQEMFNRWEACTPNQEFAGCSEWTYKFAHEQAAFSNYLRYEYGTGNDLRVIACNEANGNRHPGRSNHGCNGTLISHYWHNKRYTVTELYKETTSCMPFDLHNWFLENQRDYFVDASNLTHPLTDLRI